MVTLAVFLSSFRLLITNLSDVTLKNGGEKTQMDGNPQLMCF